MPGLQILRTNHLSFGQIPALSGLRQTLVSLMWIPRSSDVRCVPWSKHGALGPNQFLLLIGPVKLGPPSRDEKQVGGTGPAQLVGMANCFDFL